MDRVQSRLTEIAERVKVNVSELQEIEKRLRQIEQNIPDMLRRKNLERLADRINEAWEGLAAEANALSNISMLSENWRDVAMSNGVVLPEDDG